MSDPDHAGYYGLPVIHGPHWKWLIIIYFYLGGISGASAFIGAVWRLTARPAAHDIAPHALAISVATLAPCPLLLILDLGRPRRFLNMLRVVRPSSPMSIGTWGLTAFGLTTAMLALAEMADMVGAKSRDICASAGVARRILVAAHGLTGLFVASYTGVLLATTAVPLWAKRPALLGPLFLSSALSSGAAAISLTLATAGSRSHVTDGALQRFEVITTIAKGALFAAWHLSLRTTAKPLWGGSMGYVVRGGVMGGGVAAPLLINAVAPLLPQRWRRLGSVAASVFTLAGVFALRYAVVEGGRRSADDPQATFDFSQ